MLYRVISRFLSWILCKRLLLDSPRYQWARILLYTLCIDQVFRLFRTPSSEWRGNENVQNSKLRKGQLEKTNQILGFKVAKWAASISLYFWRRMYCESDRNFIVLSSLHFVLHLRESKLIKLSSSSQPTCLANESPFIYFIYFKTFHLF